MTERESERESENEPGKEGGEGEQANSYHAKAYSGRTRLAMSCLCRTILQRPGLRFWMYQREHSTSPKSDSGMLVFHAQGWKCYTSVAVWYPRRGVGHMAIASSFCG